jgi:hypothetical protein
MNLIRVLVVAFLIVSYSGILGCGGGGAELRSNTYTTTLGQELQDLEAAYNKGIITEKQYNEAKKTLIEKRTQK